MQHQYCLDGMHQPRKILKREYSRAGCQECKRRKIKCDELRPACGNCVRCGVDCVFPGPNIRNRPRQKRTSKPGPAEPASSGSSVSSQTYSISHVSPQFVPGHVNPGSPPLMASLPSMQIPAQHPLPSDLDMLLYENVFDDANTLVNDLADFENHVTAPDVLAGSRLGVEKHTDLKPFHSQIILNDDSKSNVFFDDEELEGYLRNTDTGSNPMLAQSWNHFFHNMAEPTQHGSNAQLMQMIVDTFQLPVQEQNYLHDIVFGRTCRYFFPFTNNTDNNEVMSVILEFSMVLKYMVYAMMAVSASCQFNITKDPVHQRNQRKYTRVCMKLIVRAFTELTNNEISLWNIEGLILTVLLLTMLFCDIRAPDPTQKPHSWIVHLRSAQSLLVKYKKLKGQSSVHRPESLGIVIAKSFFFFYDWGTTMCLPLDRINREHMSDLWAITGHVDAMTQDPEHIASLRHLGLFIPASPGGTSFNTFSALTPEVTRLIFEVMDTMARLNEEASQGKKRQASPEAISNIMALINAAMTTHVIPGVSSANNYVISLENPAHPAHPNVLERIVLPVCAYGIDTDSPLQTHFSWCDVVVQSYAIFLYLKVLTTPGLLQVPCGHPLIESLIEEMMGLLFFMKPKSNIYYNGASAFASSENYYLSNSLFDHRAIMISIPYTLLVELTNSERDLEKLNLFFDGMVRLGCGFAVVVAERAEKNRQLAQQNQLKQARALEDPTTDYYSKVLGIF